MMAAGSSTVSLNERLFARALMSVVELGRGGTVNQQSLSSLDFAPTTVPHNF